MISITRFSCWLRRILIDFAMTLNFVGRVNYRVSSHLNRISRKPFGASIHQTGFGPRAEKAIHIALPFSSVDDPGWESWDEAEVLLCARGPSDSHLSYQPAAGRQCRCNWVSKFGSGASMTMLGLRTEINVFRTVISSDGCLLCVVYGAERGAQRPD